MNGGIKTTGFKHLFCCMSNSGRAERKKTTAEPPLVTQVAGGLRTDSPVDWSALPQDLMSEIAVYLNKHNVSRLMCACRAFNTGITESYQIKRPLKEIRDGFKQEVGALPSGTEIPGYMYNHVRVLSGHENSVSSVTQLTDGRIVSGSYDKTLRVWGYVDPETGDAS